MSRDRAYLRLVAIAVGCAIATFLIRTSAIAIIPGIGFGIAIGLLLAYPTERHDPWDAPDAGDQHDAPTTREKIWK
jgi:hypothetical protein